MNNLAKAAQTLRTGWCRDAFKKDLPQGTSFCAMGALGQAILGTEVFTFVEDSHWDIANDSYLDWKHALVAGEEVRLLDEVIRANYPDQAWDTEDYEASAACNVIFFNDHVAEHSDEVVAMFEKAAVKWDERV